MVLGLAGVVAFVAKKLSDREASSAWQSAYTPTPASPAATPGAAAPTPSAPQAGAADETPLAAAAAAAAAAAPPADDEGAAEPGEAAADATDTPHPSTTPDAPAEEVEVQREDEDNS